MSRPSGRKENELRAIELIPHASKHAEGSCLIKWGDTHVMCTASIEEKVPQWVKGTGQGWVTAEYGMLPRATNVRVEREAKKGQTGRTHEIQRLIARALRICVDLKALDMLTVKLDCDVIQADGGTRTAAITGGFVALYLALQKRMQEGKLARWPISGHVAAVSCGIVAGTPVLDLDYAEDARAETDANFVMTDAGRLVEVQGTAERAPFSAAELSCLLELAAQGTQEIVALQKKALGIPAEKPAEAVPDA